MLKDRLKNKIYASVSISVIAFAIASFVLTVNFLIKINNLVFKIDENLVNEKATVFDAEAYGRIKNEIEKTEKQ